MAMTMRNARRLLVLALGVAGVALAAGAPGAGAVVLDCTGTARWTMNPPLSSINQTMTITTDETFAACTGDGVLLTPSGNARGTYSATGSCHGVSYLTTSGTKRFFWPVPNGWFSDVAYTSLTNGGDIASLDLTLRGRITAGIYQGYTATEELHVTGLDASYFRAQCLQTGASMVLGTAHLTIN